MTATRVGRDLLGLVFPIECVGCGGSGSLICDSCTRNLPALLPPFCDICASPGDFARCQTCAESVRRFDGIRAPYRYAGPIRQAVLALKYGGIRAGSTQLGDMLADYLTENPLPVSDPMVIPVPMHRSRQRDRGYNQAELLANRVARRCDLHYEPSGLVRIRNADPQAGIADPNARADNVAGSVAVAAGVNLAGRDIILVDDVATTGSTMDVCAAALKQAGARSVWGLTLAVASGTPRQ